MSRTHVSLLWIVSLVAPTASAADPVNTGVEVSPFGGVGRFDGTRQVVASPERGIDRNGDGDGDDWVIAGVDVATMQVTWTGLAVDPGDQDSFAALEQRVLVSVSENAQGHTDLDGDGLVNSAVLHEYEWSTGTVTSYGIATYGLARSPDRQRAIVWQLENGTDANGDGDGTDGVLDLVDAAGVLTPLSFAVQNSNFAAAFIVQFLPSGEIAARRSEAASGASDFNGDGDANDFVVHVLDPTTMQWTNSGLAGTLLGPEHALLGVRATEIGNGGADFNGDGDAGDVVLFVRAAAGQPYANVGLALPASASTIAAAQAILFPVSESGEGQDLNGDGDSSDFPLFVRDVASGATSQLPFWAGTGGAAITGTHAFYVARESLVGSDVDADGDTSDLVPADFDAATGALTLVPHAVPAIGGFADAQRLAFSVSQGDDGLTDYLGGSAPFSRAVFSWTPATATERNVGLEGTVERIVGDFALVEVDESHLGKDGVDLNSDSDAADRVLFIADLARGTWSNTRLPFPNGGLADLHPGHLAVAVPESSADLNADGDRADTILFLFENWDGGAIETLGHACPLSNGELPELFVAGELAPGGRVVLETNHGVTNQAALLFLGTTPGSLTLPGGCLWSIGAPLPLVIGPLPLEPNGKLGEAFGQQVELGTGFGSGTLLLQAAFVDPGKPSGYALSAAQRLTFAP